MRSLRQIPSIDLLLQRPGVKSLEREYGRDAIVEALRLEAASLREALGGDRGPGTGDRGPADAAALIEAGALSRLRATLTSSLRPVINATGVVIHTNLGRAPLARAAAERAA